MVAHINWILYSPAKIRVCINERWSILSTSCAVPVHNNTFYFTLMKQNKHDKTLLWSSLVWVWFVLIFSCTHRHCHLFRWIILVLNTPLCTNFESPNNSCRTCWINCTALLRSEYHILHIIWFLQTFKCSSRDADAIFSLLLDVHHPPLSWYYYCGRGGELNRNVIIPEVKLNNSKSASK